MITRNTIVAAVVGWSCGFVALPVHAEWQFSIYGGDAYTLDSDVTLSQPTGVSGTFSDVSWNAKSFVSPPYYGLRLTYWSDVSDWGTALDYTHAKTYSDLGKAGYPGGTLGSTFSTLEFTDGLNLLTINAVRRWNAGAAMVPYVGAGAGLSIPHVEVTTSVAPRTFEYQIAGFAAQGFAGVNFRLADQWSMFGEYKLSYAGVDADLDNGGSLSTDLWTNHFIMGLSFNY